MASIIEAIANRLRIRGDDFTNVVASSNRSSQPALSLIEGFNRYAPIKPFDT